MGRYTFTTDNRGPCNALTKFSADTIRTIQGKHRKFQKSREKEGHPLFKCPKMLFVKKISLKYGISQDYVYRILKGNTWNHLP